MPRKSVVRLTDRPDMTLDVYRGRKTTIQYNTTSLQASECIDWGMYIGDLLGDLRICSERTNSD